MNVMKTIGAVVAAGVVMAVAIGCDTTKSTDTVLTVTPASKELTSAGETATFTVSAAGTNTTIALPLVWTVSDSTLGGIKESSGLTAVYQSSGKVGVNVITVKDQGDAEGIATVTQK